MEKIDTKKLGIGILIFLVVILGVIGIKKVLNTAEINNQLTQVYGAVGGGKENLLADEKFNEILADKYKIEVVNDSWSNGKLVVNDVIREDGSKYDFIFFSDQR